MIWSKKGREIKKLLAHPIFKKIEYWDLVKINNIEINNIAKKNMIKVFLKLYLKQFKIIFIDFIDSGDYMTPEKIIPIYLDALDKIEKSAILKCIPVIFLDKFNLLQRDHLGCIYNSIENIVTSNFYKNYTDKTTAILDVFMYHLVFIVLNSEKSLNELNGQMEKVLENSIFSE